MSIERMQDLIGELRELIQDFNLDEHNDEGNEDHITSATAALDQLDGAVSDLVP